MLGDVRIAAPQLDLATGIDAYDCMMAVTESTGSSAATVWSMTRYQATYGSLIDVRQQSLGFTTNNLNSSPVVTYCGKTVLLAWACYDVIFGYTVRADIIGVWLTYDGHTLYTAGALAVINKQLNDSQFAPSIESRGGATGGGSVSTTGFATWVDESSPSDIVYKPFTDGSSSFRPTKGGQYAVSSTAERHTQVGVYPTPATPDSRIQLQLAATEKVQTLQVLDALTGSVVSSLPTNELAGGSTTSLTIPNLSAGLYLLRLVTDKGPYITRFSYQP